MFPLVLVYVIVVHGLFSNSNVILTGMFNGLAVPLHDLFNASVQNRFDVALDAKGMSLVTSILPTFEVLGNLVSVLLVVPRMDSLGRRIVAIHLRLIFVVSSSVVFIVAHYTVSIEVYGIAQFVLGFIEPMKMIVLKLYLAECVPRQYRAFIAIAVGSFVIFANLFSSFLFLPSILGNSDSWQFIPLICILMELLYFAAAVKLPESPKWLMATRKCDERVTDSILFYHGKSASVDVVKQEIQDEIELTSKNRLSLVEILRDRTFRSVFSLVFVASLISTLSVAKIGQFYVMTLLLKFGYVVESVLFMMSATQIVFLPLIFVTPFLFERVGRRPMFLFSSCASVLNIVAYTVAEALFDSNGPNTASMALGVVAVFLSSLAVMSGLTITYVVLIADLLPPSAKVVVSQFVLSINLLISIPAVFLFPNAVASLGAYGFVPFLVIQIFLLAFLYWTLPETKLNPVASNVHNVMMDLQENARVSCRKRPSICGAMFSTNEEAKQPLLSKRKSYGSTTFNL